MHPTPRPLASALLLALFLAHPVAAQAEPPAQAMSSNDAWIAQFEHQYPQYRSIGAVPSPREDGHRTASGIRVPTRPGHFLTPRPFYKRREAAFVAWQGYIHYAELLEVGHDPAALTLHHSLGHMPRDHELDLIAYTGWSQDLVTARDGVVTTITIGDTAIAMEAAAETLVVSRIVTKTTTTTTATATAAKAATAPAAVSAPRASAGPPAPTPRTPPAQRGRQQSCSG